MMAAWPESEPAARTFDAFLARFRACDAFDDRDDDRVGVANGAESAPSGRVAQLGEDRLEIVHLGFAARHRLVDEQLARP